MAKNAERYEVRWEDSADQLPYVVLVAGNGEVLLKTESYANVDIAKAAIHDIRKIASTEKVVVKRKPEVKNEFVVGEPVSEFQGVLNQ